MIDRMTCVGFVAATVGGGTSKLRSCCVDHPQETDEPIHMWFLDG